VFSKIENSLALENIDDIIDISDGIIVARGDLGINFPIYKVPVIQKELIKKCRLKNKPVVVATQMLESMIENESPTRAEVSDVANAILDGADFVMLSAETTVGKYPAKTVEMMNNVIKNTEDYQDKLGKLIL
jgi:pyruvate kinase